MTNIAARKLTPCLKNDRDGQGAWNNIAPWDPKRLNPVQPKWDSIGKIEFGETGFGETGFGKIGRHCFRTFDS